MSSIEPSHVESLDRGRPNMIRTTRIMAIIVVLAVLVGTALITLNITTLVKVNNQQHREEKTDQKLMMRQQQQSSGMDLVSSIRIEEVMTHLNELQRIANGANGTRAVDTEGFNQTIDFITKYLKANTNYKVSTSFFPVFTSRLTRPPILLSSINGTVTNHTFSSTAANTEFFYAEYTRSTDFEEFVELSVIPNVGCSEEDWQKTVPSPANRVALVKRGVCTFVEKATLAVKYNVRALLIYNDGTAEDRQSPLFITLGPNNTLPALFLSFKLGQQLADNARIGASNVKVRLNIQRVADSPTSAINICADTPTGDPTQTILIGSHSDSVTEGPGINDNGSGSAANLALAVALGRLFRTSTYPKYKYRVRFCWWGAEEVGLLGSEDHVKQAKLSTTVGERLQDYLINLNYDMLGSPNYMFGIYDGRTARNDTPASALPGSNKITALFREWFISQNLPWDYTEFDGRSDYGPFLEEGIVAGGLFSGADDTKSKEQRDRYDAILGQGLGGIPDIIHDPCYHEACDSIQNINVAGYEKMVKAAAYALEYLGRMNDLKSWLYPAFEIQQLTNRPKARFRVLHGPQNKMIDSPDF